MLRKKVILMGDSAVGKTSLIARWVKGVFSDKYMGTIGVKIEKKNLHIDGEELMLQIWDLEGGSEIKDHTQSYIQGTHACLFVVDATRRDTLQYALRLHEDLIHELGNIPYALSLNKEDIENNWTLSKNEISELQKEGWVVFKTSAKSGRGVEPAFLYLVQALLKKQDQEKFL